MKEAAPHLRQLQKKKLLLLLLIHHTPKKQSVPFFRELIVYEISNRGFVLVLDSMSIHQKEMGKEHYMT